MHLAGDLREVSLSGVEGWESRLELEQRAFCKLNLSMGLMNLFRDREPLELLNKELNVQEDVFRKLDCKVAPNWKGFQLQIEKETQN